MTNAYIGGDQVEGLSLRDTEGKLKRGNLRPMTEDGKGKWKGNGCRGGGGGRKWGREKEGEGERK